MRMILRGTEGGSDGGTVGMELKRTHGIGCDPSAILETEVRT